ncbi:MAG: exodeoxyribonuclease VII small subunit [Verrucomicrobia bacterium]|nr:exodeoxyribonuclease VII small subunit [Verrucomicrobiota bacterium]
MESGDLPLEEILKKYEEGNRLIKFCAAKLNEAEKRIETLMKEKDGSLSLKEFDIEEEETGDADEGDDEKPTGEKNDAKGTDAKGEDNLF